MKHFLLVLAVLFNVVTIYGQSKAVKGSEAEKAYLEEYNKNIKLTKIRGVYIPGTLKEAFRRLDKLTPKASVVKFATAPEKQVCKKIHFGIGRWMINNWNFYSGSRMSHYLKEKGVLHPDDMAQFILRTYHRQLNDKDLDEESLIDELAKERKKVADSLN